MCQGKAGFEPRNLGSESECSPAVLLAWSERKDVVPNTTCQRPVKSSESEHHDFGLIDDQTLSGSAARSILFASNEPGSSRTAAPGSVVLQRKQILTRILA